MADPLGRKHQVPRSVKNRSQVNRVCDYVLEAERKDFLKSPSANHIYFEAYLVIFGSDEAYKMLSILRGKQ